MSNLLALLESITRALLECVAASFVLVAIVALVTQLRGVSPSMRHRCWSAATIFPALVLGVALAGMATMQARSVGHALRPAPMIDPLDLPLQRATRPIAVRPQAPVGSLQPAMDAPLNLRSFEITASWISLAAVAWLGIVTLGLGRIARAVVGSQRLAARALRQRSLDSEEAAGGRVCVKVDAEADVPVAIGLRRRLVLIPERLLQALTPAELRSVTAHEVAHLMRRDDWTDLAERVACAVMWMNPCSHLAAGLSRVWRERACDRWAAQRVGSRPVAVALWRSADILTADGPEPATLGFLKAGSLLERVRALVHPVRISRASTLAVALGFGVSFFVLGSLVVARATSFPPLDARLVTAGAMHDARAEFAVAKLHDGRVLVAGGVGANHALLRSAELYDPARNAFARVGPLPEALAGAEATMLADGRVLITGGWTARGPSARAESFDAAQQRFVPLAPMHLARAGHTATVLQDGTVLIAGGTGSDRLATRDAELFDPRRAGFVFVGPLALARTEHAATLLRDGRVLITGGLAGTMGLRSSEIYDPGARRFRAGPAALEPRFGHAAIPLRDGSVLVAGGARSNAWSGRLLAAERYEPATNRFVPAGWLQLPRFKVGNAIARLPNGNVMFAGGADEAEIYNFKRHRFALLDGSAGSGRVLGAAVELDTCAVLIAGGFESDPTVRVAATVLRLE